MSAYASAMRKRLARLLERIAPTTDDDPPRTRRGRFAKFVGDVLGNLP